jgi:hypothetical protein
MVFHNVQNYFPIHLMKPPYLARTTAMNARVIPTAATITRKLKPKTINSNPGNRGFAVIIAQADSNCGVALGISPNFHRAAKPLPVPFFQTARK